MMVQENLLYTFMEMQKILGLLTTFYTNSAMNLKCMS
jgi:hypothetical protein